MTDENDSGIDRRKLLKRIGGVGAASGLGAAASQPVSGEMELEPIDGGGGGGGGDGGSTGCSSDGDYCNTNYLGGLYTQDWTACAPQYTFGFGCRDRSDAISCRYDEYTSAGDAWDKIIHESRGYKDTGYAIRKEKIRPWDDTVEESGAHELAWEHSTTGPSSGDTVFVWAHGWQDSGWSIFSSGAGPTQATRGGRENCKLAWDAIDYYTSIAETADDNDSVHTVGFAWNSASAKLNFNSAVGQAHRYGPRNFAPFLMDLADKVGRAGTIHIGAHSLGCWMTLEALAKAHYEGAWKLQSALDSVRFICAAVPESALNHDENWVNCENNGQLDYHGGTCSGSEPYQNEPYHKHALYMPNRVKNVYYPDDEILTEKSSKEPFQRYLRYYGSSSDAVGATPVSPKGSIQWENVEATNVENHSNSYKHPQYSGDAGCGQNLVWEEWKSIGRNCDTDGPPERDPGDRDRPDGEDDSSDSGGDYGGGDYRDGHYDGGGDRIYRTR